MSNNEILKENDNILHSIGLIINTITVNKITSTGVNSNQLNMIIQLLAVGIDIPDSKARGKGYGAQALCMFIKYLLDKGIDDIYTQTWSGNERMIHIAEKIGFEEYRRKKEFRLVRGKKYDGLTFRLNMEKFNYFIKGNMI